MTKADDQVYTMNNNLADENLVKRVFEPLVLLALFHDGVETAIMFRLLRIEIDWETVRFAVVSLGRQLLLFFWG